MIGAYGIGGVRGRGLRALPGFVPASHAPTQQHPAPQFSGSGLQSRVLAALKKWNADPDVLYHAELRQRPQWQETDRELTRKAQAVGFARPSSEEYRYQGDNPAQALRDLLALRPLVFDCATAVHALEWQALLEKLGDPAFNAFIQEHCNGVLKIVKNDSPPIPSVRTGYYCARHETDNENLLPENLQAGDHLWIQGPANGYAFHPASEVNAFNVRVDSEAHASGSPALVGFVSAGTETDGRWSYEELRDLLLEAYNKPLTLRDVAILASYQRNASTEAAPHSAWTYRAAYEWLAREKPLALADALMALRTNPANLDQPSKLYPPRADSIRGVRMHSRVADLCNFQASSTLRTVARNPPLPELLPENIHVLIPGFETTLPHQKQIYAAVDSFYRACSGDKEQAADSGFQGLILYGHAGTGKTMACQAMIDKLRKEGRAIWQTDFHQGETLLSIEEQQALLAVRQQHGAEVYFAALTEKFKERWKDVDVFFIDDTNEPHSVLADVSNAALRYARQTGKKIVITANQDPIHAFSSSITFPIDSIVIRHIDGPDRRQELAWRHHVSPDRYAAPAIVGTKSATANQQNMDRHLQALLAHPGHNGVAFYGPPGIGKTTLLKDFFARHALAAEWIESHTLIQAVDLKAMLAKSDKAYLVIDDCNDPQGNHLYGSVLFSLLNNETLVNKNGDPVRMVLVSNRASWKDLVQGTANATRSRDTLTPRMESRYLGRFLSVELPADQDFRAGGAKRGEIVGEMPEGFLQADVFNLKGYLQARAEQSEIMSEAQSKLWDGGLQLINPEASARRNDAWRKQGELEAEALKKIADRPSLVLDMRGITLREWRDHWIYSLVTQALDVMESKPDYRLTIVADDPVAAISTLRQWMSGEDDGAKYLSRLQRLSAPAPASEMMGLT